MRRTSTLVPQHQAADQVSGSSYAALAWVFAVVANDLQTGLLC